MGKGKKRSRKRLEGGLQGLGAGSSTPPPDIPAWVSGDVSEEPKETVSIEDVTPDMAAEWLENMIPNRNVSDSHVEKYQRDMEAGRWYLTNQGFGFNRDGQLVDGQTRLWAVVYSGVTIRSVVVRNMHPNAVSAVDETRKRTTTHDIQMKDDEYRNLSNGDATLSASVARHIMKYEAAQANGYAWATAKALSFSRYELMDGLLEIKELVELKPAFSAATKISRKHKAPKSATAAAYVLAQLAYGAEYTEDFFARVGDNVGMQPGMPEKALIDRFYSESSTKPKPVSDLYLAWILRALQASHRGLSLQRIEFKGRWPREYPIL